MQNSRENTCALVIFCFQARNFFLKKTPTQVFFCKCYGSQYIASFVPNEYIKNLSSAFFSSAFYLYIYFFNIFSIDFARGNVRGNPTLLILWFINFIEHLQWLLLIIVTTFDERHYLFMNPWKIKTIYQREDFLETEKDWLVVSMITINITKMVDVTKFSHSFLIITLLKLNLLSIFYIIAIFH